MKKAALTAIVLLLLVITGGVIWKFYTSPQYSLRVIQKAVQEHDVTTFEKYVDVEGMISRLLAELPGIISGRKDLNFFGEEAAQLIQEFAKDTVVKAGKTAVETFIERGHFDREITETGVLAKFAKEVRIDHLEFAGPNEIRKEGKICYVTAPIHIAAYGGGGVCQLVEKVWRSSVQ